MQKTRTPILLALSFAALSLTAANTAFASSYIHPSNSEKGYVAVPEHFKATRPVHRCERSRRIREERRPGDFSQPQLSAAGYHTGLNQDAPAG